MWLINYDDVHTVAVVKRNVAESVPDKASVHTRNTAFEAVSAPFVESETFRIG